ncbi:MAG: asparagine--tRNA ligase [Clostridia bacterium]|nr:asparagine--tRNA ligase [Clostridia bacterium]
MKHADIKDILNCPARFLESNRDSYDLEDLVPVCGWVRTSRESKNVAFLEINDGTCLRNLQVVIIKDRFSRSEYEKALPVGTSVCVTGTLVPSEKNGVELLMETVQVLGECPQDFPLQKKHHTLEYLRTIPHLRPRTRYFEAVLRMRSTLSFAIHEYFQSEGFVYVHTPIITGSDCEGAGEMFRVTTNAWDAKGETAEEYYRKDFFGAKAGLTVSGQLEGEMAAMGLGRIYTFGPTFRAEHSNTTRHAAEFWQIEPEVCFADLNDIMDIAEDFIKSIVNSVLGNCQDELEYFEGQGAKGLRARLYSVVHQDFARVSYTEAIQILQKSGKEFKYPVEWGVDLQTEHERYLTEEVFKKPVFVTDYPMDIKAFYMKQNPDGRTVAATDLLVPGIGEIIGCSEREADYGKLVAAMEKRGMPLEAYREYLDTRKYGSVPHSGFGLGFERMLMYVTGVQNIRDTLLFPRTVGSL